MLTCLLLLSPLFVAAEEWRGVVGIRSLSESKVLRQGLGFMVEKEGFVLTLYENLTSPDSGRLLDDITVLSNGRSHAAEVIGVEPTLNLGIIKLLSAESFTPVKSLMKREPEPGLALQAVVLDQKKGLSYIDGNVTALNTKQCYQHSLASTMFRARISIPSTSLGSPVFAKDSGEVAAIFTGFKPLAEPGHAEDSSETHLLPISLCMNIYESLKTKRSLKSPWTGFSVRALSAQEQRFFPTARKHHGGVVVEDVWDNSPAQKLGVQPGDILVQFAYNRILSVADFQKWLYMHGVGHPVKLIFVRNGTDYLMADYIIEERPAWARPK